MTDLYPKYVLGPVRGKYKVFTRKLDAVYEHVRYRRRHRVNLNEARDERELRRLTKG